MEILSEIYFKASSWLSLLPRISLANLFEILIISVLVYEILVWIRNTRAWNLLKGILVISAFAVGVSLLRLTTIVWIMRNLTTIAVTALIIVFQPELRSALDQLGSKNVFSSFISASNQRNKETFNDRSINEIIKATFDMAKVKTGALMVIERGTPLKDIERTGIDIDGLISNQLLVNIFEHNTPLHDGAVLIRGNRVVAATCYLPLSDDKRINKMFGTRHRAAVGVSEVTDTLTVVVSEETGNVSVAEKGSLTVVKDAESLRSILESAKEETVSVSRFKIWKGWLMHGKKADKKPMA